MTLIEVLVATLVVSVAATGVLSYGYHGARQRRMARAHAGAVRIGHLLLEDWKANGGSVFYARAVSGTHNPLELNMGFEYNRSKRVYEITVDSIPMRVKLTRPSRYRRLIPLKVTVRWRLDLSEGEVRDDDPKVELITNARIDQAGG
jgi:Tfp pilus assembly protein PilV